MFAMRATGMKSAMLLRPVAMVGTLQRHRARHQRAPAGATPRERHDLVHRKTADRSGPGGVFWLTVVAPQEIRLERLPTDAEQVEKAAVVQPLGRESMGDAEHQRDIGAGADRMPYRL